MGLETHLQSPVGVGTFHTQRDLHVQHAECLLPMLNHGHWLKVIITMATMDHLYDKALLCRHGWTYSDERRHATSAQKTHFN